MMVLKLSWLSQNHSVTLYKYPNLVDPDSIDLILDLGIRVLRNKFPR